VEKEREGLIPADLFTVNRFRGDEMSRLLIVVILVLISGACVAQSTPVQSVSALSNTDIGKAETSMGDLFADALRESMKTDIAFVAASEVKPKDTPIPAGAVALADIVSLVSYPDDPLAVLSLNGNMIRQALEKAVSVYPQPNLGFLQVSGLAFTISEARPTGKRVSAVTVGGAPLDDNRSYSVAVTNSLGNGALGYFKIWSKDNVKLRSADMSLSKSMDDFLKSRAKIDYSSLSRISVSK